MVNDVESSMSWTTDLSGVSNIRGLAQRHLRLTAMSCSGPPMQESLTAAFAEASQRLAMLTTYMCISSTVPQGDSKHSVIWFQSHTAPYVTDHAILLLCQEAADIT